MPRTSLYPTAKVAFVTLGSKEAKKLLGWQEEGKSTFGEDFLLKDIHGNKVRCSNNVRNRPLYQNNADKLKQEILRGRWCFNGETRIIGKTGLVLNGQHALIALVLADQNYLKDPDAYSAWKSPPTIETAIVYGVSEDDTTVNTMDTCKPRSLADVYYRSDLLKTVSRKDRKNLARVLEYGIRQLWYRTGVVKAFNPDLKDTHAELVNFATRHPRILECAKHVYTENGKGGTINLYIRIGYAAGILYLMGSSATDPAKYRKSQTEENLDWSNWSKACDFFVLLAGGNEELFAVVRSVLTKIVDDGGDSMLVRTAIIVKSWNCYLAGKPITRKELTLQFEDRDGWPVLTECPDVGGIDLGNPADNESLQQDKIDKEKAQIKKANIEKKRTTKKTKPSSVKSNSKLVGKQVWVVNGIDEPWRGKVLTVSKQLAEVKVGQGFKGAGNVKPVVVMHIRNKQPAEA